MAHLLKPRAYRFNPRTVHAQVRVPDARSRADVDQPGLRIEEELDIVHKSKDAAAKLNVPVCTLFDDEGGVSGCQHGLSEPGLGLVEIAGPAQRRHAMIRILFRQRRDTVGRGGARLQRARHDTNVTREIRRMPAPMTGSRDSPAVIVYNGGRPKCWAPPSNSQAGDA